MLAIEGYTWYVGGFTPLLRRTVGWTSFLQRILDDVAITVDDEAVDQLQPFWDLVLSRALRAYIDANGLDACLKQWLHGRLHDPHVNNRTKSAG
jgi:hypothetical protein